MREAPRGGTFQVLLPMKSLDSAKSRLRVGDPMRRTLAIAFLLDTLRAVAGCRLVGDAAVVTRDPAVADVVRAAGEGVRVITPQDVVGLNEELGQALTEHMSRGRPTAVLLPDLPALSPVALEVVLSEGYRAGRPTYVADLQGDGTTVLMSPGAPVLPRFGHLSASRHSALGMQSACADVIAARCDVDDLGALRSAVRIGVGPNTRDALRSSADPAIPRELRRVAFAPAVLKTA